MNQSSLAKFLSLSIGNCFSSSNYNRALTYHQMDTSSKFSVKFDDFKDQIKYLLDSGYSFNTISDLTDLEKNDKNMFITFDDAHNTSLKALDYLISKNIKATQFLIAEDYIKSTHPANRINSKDIIDLHNNFIEIGCHSYSHSVLSMVNNINQEIVEAKSIIENLISNQISSFSLPFGKKFAFNRSVIGAIKNAGFQFCCTQIPSPIVLGKELFIIPRIGIWSSDTIETLRLKLNGNYDFLKLLQVSFKNT